MNEEIFETPSSSPNFQTELAAQLAELVPEAIADGKIDVQKLQELISDDFAESNERFGLFWPGKKQSLRAAQAPTVATLTPDFDGSVNWDSTENLFIEGENLETLKVLQRHYHGKIRVIYVDPPYNTGKDFVYKDNFKDSVSTYLDWSKQVNDEGQALSSNLETDGRYHSNWLNMMYPRLKLARNLLADNGVIFISLDDHEIANLRLLMDTVFGESNFVENYIWESNFRPDNSSRIERENAQHVLCYARNKSALTALVGAQKATEGLPSLTKSSMKSSTLKLDPDWVEFQLPDGNYEKGEKDSGYILENDVIVKNGVSESSFSLTGRMIWSQQYLEDQVAAGTKIVIKSAGFVPYSKKLETSALAPTTLIPREAAGDVLAGNAEIKGLFGKPVFNHPKPTSLLKYLINSVTSEDKNAIILDFFAGSSSTAHAVMALNKEDFGSRKFIMIQIPEPTPADSTARELGFETIADLSSERIILAGRALANDDGSLDFGPSLDLGFRRFSLSDTNFKKWRSDSNVTLESLEAQLFDVRDSANDSASTDDLLWEVLLKQGYSLSTSVERTTVGSLSLFSVGQGLLFAYLDEHVKPTLEDLREVISLSPARFVILEDSFHGDDELKTNLVQLCKSNDVEFWAA